MYPVGKIARLYWDDLDVWLSWMKINENGEVETTSFSSDREDAVVFYLDDRDYRYRSKLVESMNYLLNTDGLHMILGEAVIETDMLVIYDFEKNNYIS